MTLFVNQTNFFHQHYHRDQEEADTLLILHGIDVVENEPFQELIVCSPDTDIFFLLVSFYKSLCARTIFRTGKVHPLPVRNIVRAHRDL